MISTFKDKMKLARPAYPAASLTTGSRLDDQCVLEVALLLKFCTEFNMLVLYPLISNVTLPPNELCEK
jgi:hypothetical protein